MAGTVVVGAGLAAAHVVATLRELGYAEPVTLVGEEIDRPYERPPLSKAYLQGTTPREEVFVHGLVRGDHGDFPALGLEASKVTDAVHTPSRTRHRPRGMGRLRARVGVSRSLPYLHVREAL